MPQRMIPHATTKTPTKFWHSQIKPPQDKNLPQTIRPGQELRLGSGWIPQAMNTIGTRSTTMGELEPSDLGCCCGLGWPLEAPSLSI